jgi:hypothetical protein
MLDRSPMHCPPPSDIGDAITFSGRGAVSLATVSVAVFTSLAVPRVRRSPT